MEFKKQGDNKLAQQNNGFKPVAVLRIPGKVEETIFGRKASGGSLNISLGPNHISEKQITSVLKRKKGLAGESTLLVNRADLKDRLVKDPDFKLSTTQKGRRPKSVQHQTLGDAWEIKF